MANKTHKSKKSSISALLVVIFLVFSSFVLSLVIRDRNQRVSTSGHAAADVSYQVIKQNLISKDDHKIFTRACNILNQLPGYTSCNDWTEVTQTLLPIMPSGTYANQIGGYGYLDPVSNIWKYRRFVLESDIENPKLQNLWWQLCPIDPETGPIWGQCSTLTKLTSFKDWVKNMGFMNNVVSSHSSFAAHGSDGYYRFVHFIMGQSAKETILYGRGCTMIPDISGEMQDCSKWIRLTGEEASWKTGCPGDPICAANGRFRSYGVYPYEENGISYLRKVAISRDGTKFFSNTCKVPAKITWSDTTINWQESCTGWTAVDLLTGLREVGVSAADTFEVYKFKMLDEYHVYPSTQP